MFENYLVEGNVIGATVIESADGSMIMMYSSVDGKHFLKSRDHFRTVDEEWVTNIGTITANANLLRLNDGRLMMPIKIPSTDQRVQKHRGSNFCVMFSNDEGHSFGYTKRVNKADGCFYLMNQRILRLQSGRIIIPMCSIPNQLLDGDFESVGWSGCFYSDDEGQSWSESNWIEGNSVDQLAEPMIAEGPNGYLIMYMRTGVGFLYYATSNDNGITWSSEKCSNLRSPCAPFSICYDRFDDRYIIIWDNSFPSIHKNYPRCPMCIAESKNGIDWSNIKEIENDPSHGYGYPMIYPFEKEILIMYYESEQRNFNTATNKLKIKIINR